MRIARLFVAIAKGETSAKTVLPQGGAMIEVD
jgi:hypothetical protein